MSVTPTFVAPLLALLLPGTLFVGCLWSMLVTVRQHRNGRLGASVYLWLAVDVLVMVFATSWLAKSLLALGSTGLTPPQAEATLNAGPALFGALALFVGVRPAVRVLSAGLARLRQTAGTFWTLRVRSRTGTKR